MTLGKDLLFLDFHSCIHHLYSVSLCSGTVLVTGGMAMNKTTTDSRFDGYSLMEGLRQ